jgi:hypothetical protein
VGHHLRNLVLLHESAIEKPMRAAASRCGFAFNDEHVGVIRIAAAAAPAPQENAR